MHKLYSTRQSLRTKKHQICKQYDNRKGHFFFLPNIDLFVGRLQEFYSFNASFFLTCSRNPLRFLTFSILKKAFQQVGIGHGGNEGA